MSISNFRISNFSLTKLIILNPIPCNLYVYHFEVEIANTNIIKKLYAISSQNYPKNDIIKMYNDFEPHDDIVFMSDKNYELMFAPLFKDIGHVNKIIKDIRHDMFPNKPDSSRKTRKSNSK